MARAPLNHVIQQLRHWLGQRVDPGLTDALLLERYLEQKDTVAFETLVHRHGTMVLDVCRSLLANEHDAEDAFQATFLVLARQAASIRRRDSLGSWLYGVAHRTSLRARANAVRRRFHESQVKPMTPPDETPEADQREVRRLLHEEIQRLPEKYRAPLVLCCLEGKTNEQAAAELGWPKGTVQTRIARGRDQLRERLAGRGVALSLAALTAALTPSVQALPPRLVSSTIEAAALFAAGTSTGLTTAAILAEEVTSIMRTSKLMLAAAAVLCVGLVSVGGGLLLHGAAANKPDEKAAAPGGVEPTAATDWYGDPLPPGAVVRLGTHPLRQGISDTRITYSREGRFLASWDGHGWGGVRLWEARTGKALVPANVIDGDAATFSADGKWLAVATADAKDHPSDQKCAVALWSTDTGKEVRRFATDAQRQIKSIPARLTTLAFSPDGKTLAAGGDHPEVWLWDIATGKEIRKLSLPGKGVVSVAFSADGQAFLTVALGDGVRWWDPASGKESRHLLQNELQAPNVVIAMGGPQVCLSPDRQMLAWVRPGLPGTVRRWDLTANKELPSLTLSNGLQGLAISADSKLLATSGWDLSASCRIRFWDMATGQEVRQASEAVNAYTYSLAFAPDGKTLATSGNESAIRLWDVASGKEREVASGHLSGVTQCAFLAAGKQVLTVGWEGHLRTWDAATGKPLARFTPEPRAQGMAVAPDDQTVALWCQGNIIVLLDVRTGAEIRRWRGHAGGAPPDVGGLRRELAQSPHSVAFSTDGKYLAAGSYDGTVPIWETATGKEQQVLKPAKDFVFSVAFAPDSKTLAAGSRSEVILADVTSGKAVRTWSGLPGIVPGLAFSSNGKTIAAGAGHDLYLWNVSGEERFKVQEEHDVNSVAFSRDGRTLAACSGSSVRLWETATNAERQRFTDPSRGASGVTVAPDGKKVAVISRDGTVLIWGQTDLAPR